MAIGYTKQPVSISDGDGTPIVVGQEVSASSVPVVIASDQSAVPISDDGGSITVDGTLTANIGTTNGLALDATLTGNNQRTRITDGTTLVAVKAASTASVAADPALVVSISPNNSVAITASSLPLPTGAATESTLATRLAESTFTSRINTLGQKTSANSTPVVISSDQSAIPISGSITATNPSVGSNSSAIPSSSTQIGGSDGTNLQPVRIKNASTAAVAADPALVVAISPNNSVDITASSLPLPTGAATESTLATRLAEATFTSRINTLGQKTSANSTPVVISSDQSTLPISAASLPLPTGAATSANQTTLGNQTTKLNDGTNTATIKAASTAAVAGDTAIVVAISPNNPVVANNSSVSNTAATPPAQATYVGGSVTTGSPSYTTGQMNALSLNTSGGLRVDGSSVTQPVSASSLPLPTGAATSANQTTLGNQTTKLNDGTNTATIKAASTAAVASDTAIVVALSPNNPVVASNPSVSNTAAAPPSQATYIGGSVTTSAPSYTTGQMNALSVNTSGGLRVDGSGVTQPISAASLPLPTGAATETTLSSINTKTPSLGQAAMAASSPVVISSDQSTLPISAASLPLPTGAATESTLATRLAESTFTSRINTLGQKTSANSTPVVISSDQSTLPVSAASLPLPTGAATETTLASINTKTLAAGQAVMSASYPVVIASNQSTLPISAASLPLPTGAATETTLSTRLADSTFTTRINTLGQKTSANSTPVVISSDQSTLPISAASLPLPTGAATESTLATRLTESTFTTRINTLGQKTSANSTPVVISSDQSTLPISAASLPLPTGAATETTLASINTKTLAAGQAVMAASSPVVISSDQSAVATKMAVGVQVDGHSASIGTTTDADTANTVIGRLKQIITKLAGGLPSALIGGRLDTNIGSWLGSTVPTVGQKTAANSIPQVVASDQWPDALARAIFVKHTDGTNTTPTGDVVARSVFNQITDGTTGPVAVKPASTVPSVTDKALVVVLSPNQPAIPVTTAPTSSTPQLAIGDVVLAVVTTAAIRRTTYTEQTTNFTGSISSNNAADAAAGTGMRTCRIYWMDATGVTIGTEDVTLNGTTPVNLVTTTKCFIEKIEGLTWGSSGLNTGIISLFTGAAGGGTLVGTIAAGNNRTFWAHHYVQSGKICNITSIFHGNSATVSGGTSFAVLRKRSIAANSGEIQISDFIRISGATNSLARNYGSVIQLAGPARVVMYVTTSSSSSITYTGSFDSYDA